MMNKKYWTLVSFLSGVALSLSACNNIGNTNLSSAQETNKLSVESTSSIAAQPELDTDEVTLRSLADQRGIGIGAAVSIEPLQKNEIYGEILAREFNVLATENAMKFARLYPERDRYNFTAADKLVDFAEANQMEVHAHVLVWHSNLPKWLTEEEWTREEVITILREHIYKVVDRYKGRVAVWDVVNEAMNYDGSLRDSFWLREIGPEYIAMAFRWAHEADPQARLFYNDHDGEEINSKSDAIYNLVKKLQQQGVPIHGVGLQMHKKISKPPKSEQVAANMKRINQLGLEVQITEMDVQTYEAKGNTEEKLTAQAKLYQEMLEVCLAAENCTGFTVWGVADHLSWIPYFFDRPDFPLLFDENYRPKSAYYLLRDTLSR